MYIFDQSSATSVGVVSAEQFANYYQGARVVSMESLGQYLQRTKDIFVGLKNFFSADQDKFVQETQASRNEVNYLAKQVSYGDFRLDSITRPEMMSSLYIDYLEDLAKIAERVHTSVGKSLDNLKIATASFINEYQEGQLDSLYGHRYFVQERKVIDDAKDINKKHYRLPANKVNCKVQDVIKSMTDFEKIFVQIDICASVLNSSNAERIASMTKSVTELIDALVDQNLKTGVLLRSEGAKKELLDAIDQTARAVEFYTALHAEFFALCSNYKRLTEALKARG